MWLMINPNSQELSLNFSSYCLISIWWFCMRWLIVRYLVGDSFDPDDVQTYKYTPRSTIPQLIFTSAIFLRLRSRQRRPYKNQKHSVGDCLVTPRCFLPQRKGRRRTAQRNTGGGCRKSWMISWLEHPSNSACIHSRFSAVKKTRNTPTYKTRCIGYWIISINTPGQPLNVTP